MPVPRITREELKARLDAGDGVVVADARLKYPFEHSTVTLPGAVRLSPEHLDFSVLPSGRDVVVYDSDPDELVSAPVVATLIQRGTRAFALKGGIADWMAASLPTESKAAAGAAESPAAASKA